MNLNLLKSAYNWPYVTSCPCGVVGNYVQRYLRQNVCVSYVKTDYLAERHFLVGGDDKIIGVIVLWSERDYLLYVLAYHASF